MRKIKSKLSQVNGLNNFLFFGAHGKTNIKQELRSNRSHGRTIRLCTKINPSRIISQGSVSANSTARGKRGNIMTRVTQKDLDRAIEELCTVSKLDMKPYNCYGYSQLRQEDGSVIESTLGCTKKELYYQIQFFIQMKRIEVIQ